MDFEWDEAKQKSNRRKHRIDFATAAKVFLDPHLIEFDETDASREACYNAIGLVDGRMLFVTYTMRVHDARRCHPHHFSQRSRAT